MQSTMQRSILAAVAALAALCVAHVQASTADDTHYVAAVVDYYPKHYTGVTDEENIMKHIEALETFMSRAADQKVDILVFPEEGLRGWVQPFPMRNVPAGGDNVIPCGMSGLPKPLVELSCLAIKYKMYLVVNLVHQVPCDVAQDAKCPADKGFYNYNTNVAFDRKGTVVARYHKYNLFGEAYNSVPPSVEYITFDTDFGVRFGMFICFDILFDKPAAQLARERNVTDFVFSAAWFSEVPFLSAVQAHSGWAHSLDVTLLAAAINSPDRGATGSGIYRGQDGIMSYVFNPKAESTLLVRTVPKKGHWHEGGFTVMPLKTRIDLSLNYQGATDPYDSVKGLAMITDNLTTYTTALLPRPEVGSSIQWNHVVKNNGLECRFYTTMTGKDLTKNGGGGSSAASSIHGATSRARVAAAAAIEEAEADDVDGLYYRAVAFNGVRDHAGHVASTGVQTCGIVACRNNKDLKACAWNVPHLNKPTTIWTEFNTLRVSAEYDRKDTLQFPSTQVGPRYDTLPAYMYLFGRTNGSGSDREEVNLYLKTPVADLRTFAIYGRNFAVDGNTPTGQ